MDGGMFGRVVIDTGVDVHHRVLATWLTESNVLLQVGEYATPRQMLSKGIASAMSDGDTR